MFSRGRPVAETMMMSRRTCNMVLTWASLPACEPAHAAAARRGRARVSRSTPTRPAARRLQRGATLAPPPRRVARVLRPLLMLQPAPTVPVCHLRDGKVILDGCDSIDFQASEVSYSLGEICRARHRGRHLRVAGHFTCRRSDSVDLARLHVSRQQGCR